MKKEINRKKAAQLLIGFFIMMFILAVLSKIADSLTIAKVEVQYPKNAGLTFEVSGTGTVFAGSKEFVRVSQNIGVEEINVHVGDSVKKGQLLVSLSQADILAAWEEAEDAVMKLEYAGKAAEILGRKAAATSSAGENAEAACHNAQEDRNFAKTELDKAEKEYEKYFLKKKEDILSDKQKGLEDAKAAYEECRLDNENTLTDVRRNAEDAKTAYQDAKETDDLILSVLTASINAYETNYGEYAELLKELNGIRLPVCFPGLLAAAVLINYKNPVVKTHPRAYNIKKATKMAVTEDKK